MSKRFHVDPNERVSVYEFDPSEVISDTPPNIVIIRARMTVEIAGRVQSELVKLGADNKPETHIGAHVGALLLHNIVGWSGPDFDDLPCTPENIRMLPSAESDPFIQKVADAIGAQNTKASPNPKSASTNGATSAGATDSTTPTPSVSLQLATGETRSPLLRSMDGHRNRSGD